MSAKFLIGGDPEFGAIEENPDWWFDAINNDISLNGDSDVLLMNIPPKFSQLRLIDTGIFAPVGERSDPNLPIGQDGHPDIGEFRIPPAENPDEFVDNVRLMVGDLNEVFAPYENKTGKNVYLVGGSAVLDDPLGGHVHALASRSKAVCDALVMCLNLVYIPVVLVGYAPGEKFRRNYIKPGAQDSNPYGQLGDARFGWMRARHRPTWDAAAMDWRVLSSYLSHPELTGAVAALHYMVIDAFHNQEVPNPPVNLLFDEKLEEAFNDVDRSYLSKKLPEFLSYWRQFPLYGDARIQKLLQPLMQALQVADIFYPWVDIRSSWGIIGPKPALPHPRNEMTPEEQKFAEERPRAIPVLHFVCSASVASNPLLYFIQDRHRAVRVSPDVGGLFLYNRTDGRIGVETNNLDLAHRLEEVQIRVSYREDSSNLSFEMAKLYADSGFWVIGVPRYFNAESYVYEALQNMEDAEWL